MDFNNERNPHSGPADLDLLASRHHRGRDYGRHLACTQTRATIAPLEVIALPQRPLEVLNDVLRSLDAHRKTHQIIADAHAFAVLGRKFTVGTHHGVKHHGVYVAQRGGAHDHFEGVHEPEDFRLSGVSHFETHHGPEKVGWKQTADW